MAHKYGKIMLHSYRNNLDKMYLQLYTKHCVFCCGYTAFHKSAPFKAQEKERMYNMKKNSIKAVVAVGIGAALFFVLGRFVSIPSGIPNTNVTLQYAILGLLSAMFGPVAGGLIGFIGHTLIDLSWGGSPWWSWVIGSAFVGVAMGLFSKKMGINEGNFGKKEIITFIVTAVVSHVVAWLGIAAVLDILIYAEPVSKAFAQGAMAAFVNSVTTIVVGVLLALAYTKTIAKKGSLDKE